MKKQMFKKTEKGLSVTFKEEIETMKETWWMGETVSSGDKKHELCGYCCAYVFFIPKMGEGLLTKQVNSACDLSLYAPNEFPEETKKISGGIPKWMLLGFLGEMGVGPKHQQFLVDVVFFKTCATEISAWAKAMPTKHNSDVLQCVWREDPSRR